MNSRDAQGGPGMRYFVPVKRVGAPFSSPYSASSRESSASGREGRRLTLLAFLFFLGGLISVAGVGMSQWSPLFRPEPPATGTPQVMATRTPTVIPVIASATPTETPPLPESTGTLVPHSPTTTDTPILRIATPVDTPAPPVATEVPPAPPTATLTPKPTPIDAVLPLTGRPRSP